MFLLANASVKGLSRHTGLTLPPWLPYIASVLLKAGYNIAAIDFNVSGFDPIRVRRVLKGEAP